MSAVTVRLPESLHQAVREIARREGISINRFIAPAVAEKVAALRTAEYLKARARRASRERFGRALAKGADVEPPEWDRL